MTKETENKNSKYRFIPYLLIGFFSIIFAVDMVFIYLAKTTWTGIATEDAYQKGLKYNQTLEYVKKQKELGWSSDIEYKASGEATGVLRVIIADKDNKVISDAAIIAKITRPVQEGFDFETPLKFNPTNSAYEALIDFPLKGQWDVEIQARKSDNIHQNTKRLIVF
ncbi:MAG: FixH family protein [Proteobacteria bacterium]|nr:FixH family protein [Pseudomonadota bacterium]